MSRPENTPPASPSQSKPRRIPIWKKLLVVLSVLLMLGAVGLRGYANLRKPAETAGAGASGGTGGSVPAGARSFVGQTDRPSTDSPSPQAAAGPSLIDTWSPTLFRVGAGFFAGFCVAYALRSLIKLTVIVAGVAILAAVGLQYAGVIQLDWGGVSQRYDAFMVWFGPRAEGFWHFLTAQLPSAGTAIAGAFLGFRR